MKNRLVLFLTILSVTILLIFANVFIQKQMNTVIKENKLVDAEFVVEGTPPVIAFSTMALGGFRGVIADVLWLRAMDLQQHARFFELVQLADWILKLQPKFSGAAAQLGWNMAYNISVATKSQEDRWRWVRRGILLLQKAISLSPNDAEIYQEIAWIYAHKLGNVMDDAQRYYKTEMARELLFIFGKHYPDWQALADAPANEKELRVLFPADHALWTAMNEAGIKDLSTLSGEFRLNSSLPSSIESKLTKEDAGVLNAYLRKQWMKETWMLDPTIVTVINQKYGELDWLLPESFAIYWAHIGNEKTPDFSIACARQIIQSLVASFNYGRMLLPKDNHASEFFLLIPNTDLADGTRNFYKDLMTHTEFNVTTFKSLYENYLIDTTVTLYAYGQKKKAREFFDELRTTTENKRAKTMTFDQFVLTEWEEDVGTHDFKQANDQLTGLMFQACLLLAYGDREAATEHLILAKRVYLSYANDKSGLDRVELPAFDEIKKQVTEAILANYPEVADRLRAEIAADQRKSTEVQTDTPTFSIPETTSTPSSEAKP